MRMIFPKWLNLFPTLSALAGVGALLTVITGTWYYATPDFWEVGYMPEQPGSGFNHQLHAGKLGMDCRYCHTNVEKSAHSNVPAVATCMGCHTDGMLGQQWDPGVEKVGFVRTAYANDDSIPWRKIHHLPGYVGAFPHHMHVRAGVSCYSCHGQITAMPVVYQDQGLGMGWCLDCHRNVEENIVPPDKVTDLVWVEQHLKDRKQGAAVPSAAQQIIDRIQESIHEGGPQNCGACHH
ncbi:MAG: cytochrome c3 family protein [Planctomycetota bacterium]